MKITGFVKYTAVIASLAVMLASCGGGDVSENITSSSAATSAVTTTEADISSALEAQTTTAKEESSEAAQEDYEVVYSGDDAVVIKSNVTSGSLEDALNALKDSGKLDYTGSQSDYGLYIEAVNGVTADASANEFWAVYTTLGGLDGVSYSSEEYGTYEYEGTLCASASFGASGLPMVSGEIYVIALESY